MDGWMDGQLDGRMNGRMNGQTERWTKGRIWMDGMMGDGWTHGYIDREMD